jgi:hypothetical protein
MLSWAITMMFLPVAFSTHAFVVSLAIMPPAIDTVSKIKTIDNRRMIRMVVDLRRNRLLEAILRVSLDRDSALSLSPVLNPKYCTGERAFIGDSLAASRMGFVPNVSARIK